MISPLTVAFNASCLVSRIHIKFSVTTIFNIGLISSTSEIGHYIFISVFTCGKPWNKKNLKLWYFSNEYLNQIMITTDDIPKIYILPSIICALYCHIKSHLSAYYVCIRNVPTCITHRFASNKYITRGTTTTTQAVISLTITNSFTITFAFAIIDQVWTNIIF